MCFCYCCCCRLSFGHFFFYSRFLLCGEYLSVRVRCVVVQLLLMRRSDDGWSVEKKSLRPKGECMWKVQPTMWARWMWMMWHKHPFRKHCWRVYRTHAHDVLVLHIHRNNNRIIRQYYIVVRRAGCGKIEKTFCTPSDHFDFDSWKDIFSVWTL